jgi:hypothetical protein
MDVGQSVISLQIMPGLFDPLTIRELTFANRVFVSPMCQYSSGDGCGFAPSGNCRGNREQPNSGIRRRRGAQFIFDVR